MTTSQVKVQIQQPVSSEPTPEEVEERWRYTKLGEVFGRKYKHVRALARRGGLKSSEDGSWWREGEVARAVGLKPEQWSNVRSKNPNSKAFLYPRHLHQLVKHFQLDEVLGKDAWKLFTPSVSFEALEAALRKARYGDHRQDQPPEQQKFSSFVIPELDAYVLKCPATLDEYDQTAEITRAMFDQDLLDPNADREAFIRNPYTMVVLIDRLTGKVLGWVDIYHLPDGDLTLMIEDGQLRVDPARTIGFPASCKVTRAYTASIAIKPDHSRLARLLIYGMTDYLLKFQFDGTETFELFVIGETEQGVNLLTRLQFEFVRMMEMEVGQRGLYCRQFSKTELRHEQQAFWQNMGLHRMDVDFKIENPMKPS